MKLDLCNEPLMGNNVRFISYSKCSNCRRISKLSNSGCSFYFLLFCLDKLNQNCITDLSLTNWPVHKSQKCKSVLIEFAPSKQQNVNKHPKFNDNFDILRQLEHFEYEMNRKYALNYLNLSFFYYILTYKDFRRQYIILIT